MVKRQKSVFIIAEAGVNHNGDLSLAKRLVDVAALSGANAVKFQTFKAENLVARGAQLEMLKKLELSFQAFRELQKDSFEKDILFLATPFDEGSLDFLDQLEIPFFKVGSGEITNHPFLEKIALKKKPMIVSTGMATLDEVKEAVAIIRKTGNSDIILLQCTSCYPTDPADANLRAMLTMQEAFGVPVGFSDHTPGIEVSLAAVALGARVIEKHFTLDKNLPGPDHRASLDPAELKALVKGIRKVEAALGSGKKEPMESEKNTMAVARKSLVAACAIAKGTVLTPEMIAIKRPGTGLKPSLLNQAVGRKTVREISEGEALTWELLQ